MFDFVESFSNRALHDNARDTSNVPKSASKRFAKRSFDILFASAMILLFLPLFVLIALAIMILDDGRPLFAQTRVGRNGKEFKCLKFRTMVKNADLVLKDLLATDPEIEQEWNASYKLRNDPRVLPVIGSLLRKSSLDELPQLINVLRGEMSIVGPRPVVPEELDRYGADKRFYLAVRPGLTGPWQAGSRSDDTYENRVRQDVAYVRNHNLTLDIWIIAKTAKVFLRGRAPGAY